MGRKKSRGKMTIQEEDESDERNEGSFPFKVPSLSDTSGKFRPQSTHKFRSSMGEFMPPTGIKPLTALALPTPGPSDYFPLVDTIYPSAPRFSLHDKTPERNVKFQTPGPKYNLRDVKKGCDLITVKRQIPSESLSIKLLHKRPLRARTRSRKLPLSYLGSYSSLSKRGAFIMSRPKEGVHIGVKNEATMQFDTIGRKNFPAPNSYYPESYPKQTGAFTFKAKPMSTPMHKSPGPAQYSIPRGIPGPRYTLKSKLEEKWKIPGLTTPSPNAYSIPTTIGKGPACSFKGNRRKSTRNLEFDRKTGPSDYHPRTPPTGKYFSFSYRPLPRTDPWFSPAPNAYDVSKEREPPRGPTIGTRRELQLNYQKYGAEKKLDLPLGYGLHTDWTADKCRTAVEIKSRVEKQLPVTVAPSAYNPSVNLCKPSPPKYSFGRKLAPKDRRKTYTHAMYSPQLPEGVAFSLLGKLKQAETDSLPPNIYTIASNVTNRGAARPRGTSLRSRYSPYMYSGFPSRNPRRSLRTFLKNIADNKWH